MVKPLFSVLWQKTGQQIYLELETKFDALGNQMAMTRKVFFSEKYKFSLIFLINFIKNPS